MQPLSFPLSSPDALQFLRDALGENYGAPTDDATLSRALGVDGVAVAGVFHARPWGTAARLIRWNTEYEVGGELQARIDRKLSQLDMQQRQMDALAGPDVLAAVAAVEAQRRAAAMQGTPCSGAIPTEAVW